MDWSTTSLTFSCLINNTSLALVSQWETEEETQHEWLSWFCYKQWGPVEQHGYAVRVYIHVHTCLWCVAFACVRSGCSVCRQIRYRLPHFEWRNRVNPRLTGTPSSHRRERWWQVRGARYEYVTHQSWERETEGQILLGWTNICDNSLLSKLQSMFDTVWVEYHFKTSFTPDFNIWSRNIPGENMGFQIHRYSKNIQNV